MLAGLKAGLVQSLDAFAPRRRLLREIRAAWGKAGDKDGWLAERYFELTCGADHRVHVDDRTWSDLEFPRIFKILDSTRTRLGSQHLFRQLRTFPGDAQQARDVQQACEVLRSDQQLRESIQLALATLSADSAATIIENILQLRSQG